MYYLCIFLVSLTIMFQKTAEQTKCFKNCLLDRFQQKVSRKVKMKNSSKLSYYVTRIISFALCIVRTYPQKILGNFFQDFASNLTIAKILNIVRTLFEENKSSYSSKFKDTNIFQKSYFDAESKIFKVNCFLYGDFFFSKIKRDDFIQSRHLISNELNNLEEPEKIQ